MKIRVLAMAQGLHHQGTKLDDAMWEKIFGHVHSKTEERFKTYQKDLVKQQQDASLKARDASGSGGGMPGVPPKKNDSERELPKRQLETFPSR